LRRKSRHSKRHAHRHGNRRNGSQKSVRNQRAPQIDVDASLCRKAADAT
jgi:hypothetical protein